MSEDRIILKSGLILEPNRGIIGISPDYETYGGYDQSLNENYDVPFTSQERRELAKIMIARWVVFAMKWR